MLVSSMAGPGSRSGAVLVAARRGGRRAVDRDDTTVAVRDDARVAEAVGV